MNKHKLTQYVLLGILSGSLLSNLAFAADNKEDKKNNLLDTTDGNMGYHLMDDDEILLQLNDEGTKLYNSLSPEGKKLAREVASARCNGTNSCKGLNGCRTDKNECAGKGSCKGQGKCAIADPNVAVKLAAKKMSEKRQNVVSQTNLKTNHK